MPPIAAHNVVAKTGVLLVNLGTPAAATVPAIRSYLREFLSDRRVVNLPALLWLPILFLFVLTTRPRKLLARYQGIWTAEGGPLVAIGRRQARKLAIELQQRLGYEVPVGLAMRYGAPNIPSVLAQMQADGVQRIAVLPLFPQYSATTTAAVFDKVFDTVRKQTFLPALHTIASYHDQPAHIQALAASIRSHWQTHGQAEHLLFSFHGIPEKSLTDGDPYHCQCHKTARLVAEALQLPAECWSLSFQSRFGKQQWLKPYTDYHLPALAARGIRSLDIIAPGFAADCLETLEEIAIEYRDLFAELGGTVRYIPALNDSPEQIGAFADLLTPVLQPWAFTALKPADFQLRAQRAAAVAEAEASQAHQPQKI